MSKVKAFTAGMLRSLDTFGVARDTRDLVYQQKIADPSVDKQNIRSDWERVGQYLATNTRLARDGAGG